MQQEAAHKGEYSARIQLLLNAIERRIATEGGRAILREFLRILLQDRHLRYLGEEMALAANIRVLQGNIFPCFNSNTDRTYLFHLHFSDSKSKQKFVLEKSTFCDNVNLLVSFWVLNYFLNMYIVLKDPFASALNFSLHPHIVKHLLVRCMDYQTWHVYVTALNFVHIKICCILHLIQCCNGSIAVFFPFSVCVRESHLGVLKVISLACLSNITLIVSWF